MEIAESSLQTLVTVRLLRTWCYWHILTMQALRRAGRLDYVRYPTVTPFAEDTDEELYAKWKQWIEHESYKRCVQLDGHPF